MMKDETYSVCYSVEVNFVRFRKILLHFVRFLVIFLKYYLYTVPPPYKDHPYIEKLRTAPYKDHLFKHESGPYEEGGLYTNLLNLVKAYILQLRACSIHYQALFSCVINFDHTCFCYILLVIQLSTY